jgi:hypothetical protein
MHVQGHVSGIVRQLEAEQARAAFTATVVSCMHVEGRRLAARSSDDPRLTDTCIPERNLETTIAFYLLSAVS